MLEKFKRKPTHEGQRVFTGKVKFIYKDQVLTGEVFGKPFSDDHSFMYRRIYHVVAGERSYDVPEHAIEEVKGE